jgi:ethanolamine utilization protein EutA
VLQPRIVLGDTVDASEVAAGIREHCNRFDVIEGDADFAIAFRWKGAPSYPRLSALARGIVEAIPRTLAAGKPLFLIFDRDIAQTIGALLKEEIGIQSEVLALDGIALWDFDYIDLGRVRMPSFTVPVTIKSLVFSEDPRIPHPHHHHPAPSDVEGHHGEHHHHHHDHAGHSHS